MLGGFSSRETTDMLARQTDSLAACHLTTDTQRGWVVLAQWPRSTLMTPSLAAVSFSADITQGREKTSAEVSQPFPARSPFLATDATQCDSTSFESALSTINQWRTACWLKHGLLEKTNTKNKLTTVMDYEGIALVCPSVVHRWSLPPPPHQSRFIY